MAQSFEEWWNGQGFFTKKLLSLIVCLTLTASFGFIDPFYFVLDWRLALKGLQVWRLLTCPFFFGVLGPGALAVLIDTYIFQMYSNRLEKENFAGRKADFLWMYVVLLSAMLLLGGGVLGMRVLGRSVLLAVVWVWCRHNPTQSLSIMGLFTVSALMFPWVLLGLHMIMGQGYLPALVGIASGHLYVYLTDILPTTHGVTLLPTPALLRKYFPDERLMGGIGGSTTVVPRPGGPPPPARSW
eukprot:RCo033185